MAFDTTFVGAGDTIAYTPSSDVAAGAVVVVGTALLGVAMYPIAANARGALAIEGVFAMPVANTEALAIGVPVYWDATNSVVTATAEDNIQFGVTLEAIAETATRGLCKKINKGAVAQNLS